jgi:peroxiredoxin family protein
VAGIEELQSCIDLAVRLMPCQMTVDVFGYKQATSSPRPSRDAGAAPFIRFAADADVSLFI